MDLLTPSSPAGLPTLSLTTNSSWLPWGRDAKPLMCVRCFNNNNQLARRVSLLLLNIYCREQWSAVTQRLRRWIWRGEPVFGSRWYPYEALVASERVSGQNIGPVRQKSLALCANTSWTFVMRECTTLSMNWLVFLFRYTSTYLPGARRFAPPLWFAPPRKPRVL